jgi:hypothetical protein
MTHATGSFEVTSWNEDSYEELDGGGKLTQASVDQKFSGDVEGDGAVQWLMAYAPEGTARFVGIQRVTGSIEGREGCFVMETSGDFDGEVATGEWTIVSASGDLEGLRGTGRFRAPKGPTASVDLDYELG